MTEVGARASSGDRCGNGPDRIGAGQENGLYKPRSVYEVAATGPTGGFQGTSYIICELAFEMARYPFEDRNP